MLEKAFLDDVEKAIVLYEDAIGHVASRTHQMIEDYGVIEALSRLMLTRIYNKDSGYYGTLISSIKHLNLSL